MEIESVMKPSFLEKSIISKILSVALATAIMTGCNSSDKTYAEYIEESEKYIQNKEFKSAEISLKNAIQKSPDAPESRFLLGKLYFDTGNTPIAAVELRRAVQLGANSPQAFTTLGKALLQIGDTDTVIEKFVVFPDDSEQLKAIKKSFSGDALLSNRQVDNAKIMYDQALQFDPNNVRAQLGLAKVSVSTISLISHLKRSMRPLKATNQMLAPGLLKRICTVSKKIQVTQLPLFKKHSSFHKAKLPIPRTLLFVT